MQIRLQILKRRFLYKFFITHEKIPQQFSLWIAALRTSAVAPFTNTN